VAGFCEGDVSCVFDAVKWKEGVSMCSGFMCIRTASGDRLFVNVIIFV
jgi:hypothetical protein